MLVTGFCFFEASNLSNRSESNQKQKLSMHDEGPRLCQLKFLFNHPDHSIPLAGKHQSTSNSAIIYVAVVIPLKSCMELL